MTKFRMINWWISKNLNTLHSVFFFAGIVVCLVGILAERQFLTVLGQWGMLIFLLIHLIHMVLHGLHRYLETFQDVDQIPVTQIKQVTGFYLVIFLFVLLLLIWVGNILPWRQAGRSIWGIILHVIRWFVSLFPKSGSKSIMEEPLNRESAGVMGLPVGETTIFAMILDQVLYVIFWTAFTTVLVWGFCRAMHCIARRMGTLHFDGDEKTFLEPELLREKSRKTESKLSGLHDRMRRGLDRSINGSIRRRYRKCVTAQLAAHAREQRKAVFIKEQFAFLTPEEIEYLSGFEMTDPNRLRIHEIYEKARYSKSGCEKADMEAMKESLNRVARL
ncbi:MAG: hypothetical protein ACI39W_00790 [Brotaphodocola sp.]